MKFTPALFLLATSSQAIKIKDMAPSFAQTKSQYTDVEIDGHHFMQNPIDIMIYCDQLQHDFKLSWDEVFKCVNDAHVASTTFEGTGLTEEQKTQFHIDFDAQDKDGDGLIDIYELQGFLDAQGEPCPGVDSVLLNRFCLVDGGDAHMQFEDTYEFIPDESAGEDGEVYNADDSHHLADDATHAALEAAAKLIEEAGENASFSFEMSQTIHVTFEKRAGWCVDEFNHAPTGVFAAEGLSAQDCITACSQNLYDGYSGCHGAEYEVQDKTCKLLTDEVIITAHQFYASAENGAPSQQITYECYIPQGMPSAHHHHDEEDDEDQGVHEEDHSDDEEDH